jgi:tetratricopeptide (TPR) repeat protein
VSDPFAALVNEKSLQLSALGALEPALVAIDVVVRRCRATNDAPGLATALGNRATILSELGRTREALETIDEALVRGGAGEPRAAALGNRATILVELGRPREALAASDEALHIYAAKAPAFAAERATVWTVRSTILSELCRPDDALAAIECAVELRRELARADPCAFLPELAGALNNWSNRLGECGQLEGALAASEEAVRIQRRLPRVNASKLALALTNLGRRLGDVGLNAAGVAAIQEALCLILPELRRSRPLACATALRMAHEYVALCARADAEPDGPLVVALHASLVDAGALDR